MGELLQVAQPQRLWWLGCSQPFAEGARQEKGLGGAAGWQDPHRMEVLGAAPSAHLKVP